MSVQILMSNQPSGQSLMVDEDEVVLVNSGDTIAAGGNSPTVEFLFPHSPVFLLMESLGLIAEGSASTDVGIEISYALNGVDFVPFVSVGVSLETMDAFLTNGTTGQVNFTVEEFDPGVTLIRLRLINNDGGNVADMNRIVVRFREARTRSGA